MRWCSVLAVAALSTQLVQAQERLRPATAEETWLSVGIQGRPSILRPWLGEPLTKRLRTNSELGFRSADSFFAGRQFYVDLGAGYKVSDKVVVGGEFRYAYRSEAADRQRACLLFEYTTELERLELGYRFDYQHNFRPYGEEREILRNKFILAYNIPKWKLDPKGSVEFFQWAGHQGLIYFGTRYKLGTEWSPKKGHTIGFGVLHDRERAVYAPSYRFIAAVDYTINLRKN